MKGSRLSVTLLLVLFAATSVFAQSGKITGRVTDAGSGVGLPGVNVFIEGTTQGASTDVDGGYTIIGVRPGTYDLLAAFVGYATQRQTIEVSVDLTTTVNFVLAEEVFEGQEVVVTADKIAVKKDLTSSEARVTADVIDKLPVNELSQVLDVQAGVTVRNGSIHIRGGRSSEVQYMVDGVPVTDSYNNTAAFQVENGGVEELQVISGTFNAEYGNAMSGIINVVTKEGRSDRWSGKAEAYAGSYAVNTDPEGEAYLRGDEVEEYADPATGVLYADVDPYSYLEFDPGHFSNVEVSLEGPIVGESLTFFGLGRWFRNEGWNAGVRLYNMDGTPGDSQLVYMDDYEKFSWQTNLHLRVSSAINVTASGLGSFTQSRINGEFLFRRWAPDGRLQFFDDGYNAKVKMTHLLGPTAYYTVNVSTFYRKEEAYTFEDPFDEQYNDFDISPPDTVLTGGGRFARGGTNLGRGFRTTRSYLAKFDYESQISSHHLVKLGLSGRLDQLKFEYYSLIPALAEDGTRIEPFEPAIPPVESSSFNSYDDINPMGLTAYIQDKIEYESFIVNAGLRFDFFDSRSAVPADPSDPNIYNPLKKTNRYNDLNGDGIIDESEEVAENAKTVADREEYWWSDASTKMQISPRLGVAYPITEQGVIHFSAGMFFQVPTMQQLFDQYGYKLPIGSGTYGIYGNPDINPQRTAMYEIGFKQGFNDLVLDITAYYRDVRDWVSTSTLIETALPGVNYVVFANQDYSNTKGITGTFKKILRDNYGFDFNYTFQVVEGSNSNPDERFIATQAGNEVPIALLPLEWDQRHKLAGAFYYASGGFGGSVRFRFESGFPYTPSFQSAAVFGNNVQPEFAQNSRRIPNSTEFDLGLNYTFSFGSLEPQLFMDIFNVFDSRIATGVYSDTGQPDLTLEEFRQGSVDPGFWVRPQFYREPRRVQLGLKFKF
jgi:hypothetical protein